MALKVYCEQSVIMVQGGGIAAAGGLNQGGNGRGKCGEAQGTDTPLLMLTTTCCSTATKAFCDV